MKHENRPTVQITELLNKSAQKLFHLYPHVQDFTLLEKDCGSEWNIVWLQIFLWNNTVKEVSYESMHVKERMFKLALYINKQWLKVKFNQTEKCCHYLLVIIYYH